MARKNFAAPALCSRGPPRAIDMPRLLRNSVQTLPQTQVRNWEHGGDMEDGRPRRPCPQKRNGRVLQGRFPLADDRSPASDFGLAARDGDEAWPWGRPLSRGVGCPPRHCQPFELDPLWAGPGRGHPPSSFTSEEPGTSRIPILRKRLARPRTSMARRKTSAPRLMGIPCHASLWPP